MASKKTAKVPKTPERKPASTSNTYPLHEAWYTPEGSKEPERTCAAFLLIPETIGLQPDGTKLFCIGCKGYVAPEQGQREQAERAAAAEGARPIEHGETVPGTLSADERACLYYTLRAEDAFGPNERESARGLAAATKVSLEALGYVTDGRLNDDGRKLAKLVAAPEVPVDRLHVGHDTSCYAKAEAKRQKKPRAKKHAPPATPMVCECSHGVAAHVSRHGKSDTDPCSAEGCGCRRYRQVKPAKKTKTKEAA